MAAIGDQPWRGACRADHYITATPDNNRRAWVTTTVGSALPTDDQATWEGNPNTSITLRFKWTQNGAPTGSAPNFATVEIRIPDGSIVGSAWTVTFPAVDTEVTRTFHFDSDPLNESAGSARSGGLEIYLNWGNTGGVTPWNADSRGGGTPAALNSIDHAQGYLRSRVILSTHSISNASLGGAEPATFAYPDSMFVRDVLSATFYESNTITQSLRQAGAQKRTKTATGTTTTRDFSYTSASDKFNGNFTAGSNTFDSRLNLTAATFGADNKYAWASSGQAAGWGFTSETQLDATADATGNPNVTITPHAEKDSTLGSHPADNVTAYVISADQLFAWALDTQNARAELLNNETLTFKLRKPDGSDVTAAQTTRTTDASGDTTTVDWTAFMTAPAGNWTQRIELSNGATQVGSQTLGFASAYTANRMIAWQIDDEVEAGSSQIIVAEYIDSVGSRLVLDAAPTLRIYKINSTSGATTDELAAVTMTQIGSTAAYKTTWTPSADGVYIVELRGAYSGGGVEGTQKVTVKSRYAFDAVGIFK